jgi:hypothetical protein
MNTAWSAPFWRNRVMRPHSSGLFCIVVALLGSGSNIQGQPPGERKGSYPIPRIIQHKIESNTALSMILKREVPGVLELTIMNSGASGKLRIRAEQGQKSWEQRIYLAEGEQRTVRISLPGAETGIVTFGAQADPPPSALSDRPSKGRETERSTGEFLWQRFQAAIFGLIIAAVLCPLILLVKSLGRKTTQQGNPRSATDSEPSPSIGPSRSGTPQTEQNERELCYLCGKQLKADEFVLRVCQTCRA